MFSFFFNDTATTEIYTLSLHDALPIYCGATVPGRGRASYVRTRPQTACPSGCTDHTAQDPSRAGQTSLRLRSEEHTSELQSHLNLVCRLLLEKKNTMTTPHSNDLDRQK